MKPKFSNIKKHLAHKPSGMIRALFILVLAVSCSKSDNAPDEQLPAIQSAWRLTNVSGGISGISDDFDDGSIDWTFATGGALTVWNTNTDDTKEDILETGEYIYGFVPNTITPGSCAETIVIGGVNYGCVSISGNTMTLSQTESDGYVLTFEKIEIVTN